MLCIGKTAYMVVRGIWYYSWFQASNGGLGLYLPWIRGELLNFLTKLKVKRHIPRIKQN